LWPFLPLPPLVSCVVFITHFSTFMASPCTEYPTSQVCAQGSYHRSLTAYKAYICWPPASKQVWQVFKMFLDTQ
jgi:hypothetical protein